MLGRDTVAQTIAEKLGPAEKVEVVSPASLDLFGQIPTQGFVALTNNHLVFLEDSGLSGVSLKAYPRAELTFQGTGYGISGKIYQFDFQGSPVKVGSLEMAMESAIERNFQTASMIPPPPDMAAPQQLSAPPQMISSYQPPTAAESAASTPQIGSYETPQYQAPPARPQTVRPSSSPSVMNANYAPSIPGSSSKSPALAALVIAIVVFALGVVGFLFMNIAKKGGESATSISQTAAPTDDVQADEVDDPNAKPLIDHTGPKSKSILLIDGSGSEVVNIRLKDSGKYVVLLGGSSYKGKTYPEEGKAKIKDGDTDLIKVKAKDYGWKVTDGSDVTIIKAKKDGAGYKIKDDAKTLARVKPSGDAFEVTSDSGSLVGSVRADGKNWEVLDDAGALMYTVRGSSALAAAVMLALKDNPQAQAGVLLYFNEF